MVEHRGPASQQMNVRPVEDCWAAFGEEHAATEALLAIVLFGLTVQPYCDEAVGRLACINKIFGVSMPVTVMWARRGKR